MHLQSLVLSFFYLFPLCLQLLCDSLISRLRRISIVLYIKQVIFINCAKRLSSSWRLFCRFGEIGFLFDLLYELCFAQYTMNKDSWFIFRRSIVVKCQGKSMIWLTFLVDFWLRFHFYNLCFDFFWLFLWFLDETKGWILNNVLFLLISFKLYILWPWQSLCYFCYSLCSFFFWAELALLYRNFYALLFNSYSFFNLFMTI